MTGAARRSRRITPGPGLRGLGRALLAAALLLLPPPPLRAQAAEPEPVLVELLLGRIAARTVSAWRAGDEALVPLGAFFDLAELRVQRRADGAVEAILQPGNLPFVLDPASRVLSVGGERRTLRPDQLVATDTEVFLASRVLGHSLGVEWAVSWADLQVAVLDPSTLPIARRIRRDAFLRSRLGQSETAASTGLQLGLERPRLDGVVFDYSLLTSTSGVVDGSAYSAALGLDVLGGSLGLGLQSQAGADRAPRSEVSWTGIWRENPWLSQLRLGDGIATGPQARSLRGVSFGNSPYVRSPILGMVPFGGELGPGWTVEAYRGGRLVDFDSVNALGRFSFDVPVQYGENPVDFVAYGPFGEVHEFSRTYRVRTDGLPARRFEYGMAAGECRTDRCGATGNLDLRYGLTTRWTLRAGVDRFWRDSLADLTHPYVSLVGTVGNAVGLEAEAVGDAVLRGAIRFEPSAMAQALLEVTRFARGVQDPILTPAGRTSQVTLAGYLRPLGQRSTLYFESSLDRIEGITSDITSGRLGASYQVGGVRLLPAVRFQRVTGAGPVQSQTFYGLNTFVLPQPALGPTLGQLTARTALEIEQGGGPAHASAYIGAPLLKGLRGETGLSWFKGQQGPAFSILIAAELPTVRSFTTVTAGGGREALGSQYVQGSAIYNPARGGMDFAAGPALQRGGVTGRVFLDRNGNGRREQDEELLPGVRVIVGHTFAFSDSSGTYRVWDLVPFEPTRLTVDSLSLPSPLWVPAFATAMVEPSPNRYRELDLPVLPGGVVEGRVTWQADRPAPADTALDAPGGRTAGITLVFRHARSGERKLVSTFSDGTFYLMGLRPGQWEIAVDPRCLELLAAAADPIRITVAADVDGEALEGVEVRLR